LLVFIGSEFGLDETGKLTLMDEVLTPDSSRFWSKADYQVGISPKSFDKQIVRDLFSAQLTHSLPPNRYQSVDGRLHDYLQAWCAIFGCRLF
jgi:phosphoribosylaminoimidazole-succinocarboxamide synthase